LEETLDIEKPDGVLIYGDTNSTLAGAIVASKLHIPIIHVEAGLRSYNMKMPEEINRIIADSVSQLLLAPTDNAKKTLLNEGKNPDNVVVTGDVMYDVALKVSQKISFEQVLQNSFLEKNNYCVVTIHRAENTDSEERLYQIILLLEKISEKYHIIIPLHPRTKQALINLKLYDRLSANGKFSIINPLGYNDMAALMKYSCFIVSDSGGVQKEAFFHGKTCFILRNETEWVELVDSNWNVLLDNQDVNNSFNQIINYDETKREKINPYGQGDAAKIILSSILNYFQ
jgi:UDP-GlcNAc3NAcA epimerase